ncbi:beta-galactosidase [Massilia sp. TS11]|uniref:beta-galactosidase n=1 Tax=Massilia sp. TS11 TaxID=2908003 RepID=UPI001EDC34C9|nr:beta-galactosidase [Massilia sp. TS11]MCG2586797.1 beta-galactosidase [Massilia sp. TS11]
MKLRSLMLGLCALPLAVQAETLLRVDASQPAPAPLEGGIATGSSQAPGGHSLGINSRYLRRDGQPWLPVMGELHYSRVAPARWAAELHKMKAAGVDIVATYIIWNHHAPQPGPLHWDGQNDLRRFVRLAHAAGLQVFLRVGPWVHAEVRYGGLPDWIVERLPTRRDDPRYLAEVAHFFNAIGQQVRGLLWKDGGPVIGVQLENEYNLGGAGQGAGHIRTLKSLVRAAGLDVPYYTVTGWDQTLYPSGEVTPVFGSYPDEPWAASSKALGPKESYAFRFGTRVSGDLGAQTKGGRQGTAETDSARTPFLGAEYGAGLPAMYRRRTLLAPEDVAAMLPVQLGSGLNLLGYYMFHGGRNPMHGLTSMEESTRSGGYNDTPAINYDFQAPLGPDGQQRPVLGHLRPLHYFLNDFGDRLAPLSVARPAQTPSDHRDLSTPRYAARSDGHSAYLFFNSHVRQHPLPALQGVRFQVDLAEGSVSLPSAPVDIPGGSYFIWPVQMQLDGVRLRYASVQPIARLNEGQRGSLYVFSSQDGIAPEFAFAPEYSACIHTAHGQQQSDSTQALVHGLQPSLEIALTVTCPGQRPVRILLLSAAQARQLTIGTLRGQRRLVLSEAAAWFEHGALLLETHGQPQLSAAIYPALAAGAKASLPLTRSADGIFERISASAPERSLPVHTSALQSAQSVPPIAIGGPAKAALQPTPETWSRAAAWRIEHGATAGEALLEIDFEGDMARLYEDKHLRDDWYYNGQRWQIAIASGRARSYELSVLPLRADAPIYLPDRARPDFAGQSQTAQLRSVRLLPRYQLRIP